MKTKKYIILLKKSIIFLLIFLISAAFFSCGYERYKSEAVMLEDIENELGFAPILPDKAIRPTYFILEKQGGRVYETQFTYNGINCTLRLVKTEFYEDVSGVTYDFINSVNAMFGNDEGFLKYIPGKEGVATWYDVENQISYSLRIQNSASEILLYNIAKGCYPPALEDLAGSDENAYIYENGVYSRESANVVWVVVGVDNPDKLSDMLWRGEYSKELLGEKIESGKTCHAVLVFQKEESGYEKLNFKDSISQKIAIVNYLPDRTYESVFTGTTCLLDYIAAQ